MNKHSQLAAAILILLGGPQTAQVALAQGSPTEQPSALERVEITGSSIKRVDGESALPVQTISAADIKRSGASTVAELIQGLPSMQGFTSSSQSVNGSGNGATTASLHGLGSSYTLVLLNGRRMAPLNTGSTVNLNSIPLAAIERVEVLSDGASALYGSDAIAGVVNFITRKDSTEGLLSASVYRPQRAGGGSANASISKGFGDLARDRFNVLVSASLDKQEVLKASQRDFSKTGLLKFEDQGQAQSVNLVSSNSVPANASVNLLLPEGGEKTLYINPGLLKSGTCPSGQVQSAQRCLFDYPATVDVLPASERASLLLAGRVQATEKLSLFTELALSHFETTPVYAPVAQAGLPVNADLIAKNLTPLLPQLGYAGASIGSATMNLRIADAGGRRDKFVTDSSHLVLGAEASIGSVDLTASYTHSQSRFSNSAAGGYVSKTALNALIDSGKWDPLSAAAGSSTDLLAPTVLHQEVDRSRSTLDSLQARATTSLGRLPGGEIGLGLGADFSRQAYSDSPSAILMGANALQPGYADAILGGNGGYLPFNAARNSYGAFSELVLPVSKILELTGSMRYDAYDAVRNSQNFDSDGNPQAAATQGKKSASGTYKLSLRLQPSKDLLLRASLGSGFKAPSLANITQPLQSGGFTGFQSCPPGLSAAKAAFCGPNAQEYNVALSGNSATDASGLRPESSKQWALGFRYEPLASLTLGADLWNVRIQDQINNVTENTAFSNGAQYESLFKVLRDPVTGTQTLTFLSVPVNTGSAVYRGLDLDAESRVNTALGRLTTRARASWMLRADYQTPGTPGYVNSLGKIGVDGGVTFKYLLNLSATLQTGSFSHTLNFNYKPGYMDDTSSYCRSNASGQCLLTADGSPQGRYVASYALVDWQTRYDLNKALSLTFGVKNLLDRDPPFALNDQISTGNARGFDGRYADPIGRQFYLGGSYRF